MCVSMGLMDAPCAVFAITARLFVPCPAGFLQAALWHCWRAEAFLEKSLRRTLTKRRRKCAQRALGILDKLDMAGVNGSLKIRGAQGDAVAFIDALIKRRALEEHALGSYDPATSMEPRYDLFGFVIRSRRHCDETRDICSGNCTHAGLRVTGTSTSASAVSLEELWWRRWQRSPGEPAVSGQSRQSSISQEFMETEPLCLLIVLQRSADSNGRLKNNRPVSFPPRLDFLRTGAYDFAGAILHVGETAIDGHYTAACALRREGKCDYAFFDDDKRPVMEKWDFFEDAAQMGQAYVHLYRRSSYVAVQDSNGLPLSLPYAVGACTETFMQERLLVAE